MSEQHQLLIAMQIASGIIAYGMMMSRDYRDYRATTLLFSVGWNGLELFLIFTGTDYMTWQLWLLVIFNVLGTGWSATKIGTREKVDRSYPILTLFLTVLLIAGLITLIVTGQN